MNALADEVAKLVQTLPVDKAQAVIDYARSLAEKADDEQWERRLGDPKYAPKLKAMADEALAEYRAGLTQPLDPEQM